MNIQKIFIFYLDKIIMFCKQAGAVIIKEY